MGDKGFVLPAVAAVGVDDDDGVGDGMLCAEHPLYSQRSNPGGICALCLQEKLGRLVSSSSSFHSKPPSSHTFFYPSALAPAAPPYSSDSPSSPPSSSLRPGVAEPGAAATGAYGRAAGMGRPNSTLSSHDPGRHRSSSANRASGGRGRMIPFLYTTHGRKKKASGSSSSSSDATGTSGAAGTRKVMSSTTSCSSLSAMSTTTSSSSGSGNNNPVFKRSKSVATRPTGGFPDPYRATGAITEDPEKLDSPRKKSFWSFLYLYSHQQQDLHHPSSSHRSTTTAKRRGAGGSGSSSSTIATTSAIATPYIRDIKLLPQPPQLPAITTASVTSSKPHEDAKTPRRDHPPAAAAMASNVTAARGEAADDSPGSGSQASSSFGRKVARSRSVGCGSRSFSGDFLERISTGFGDCTLRRVESQREAKHSVSASGGKIMVHHRGSGEDQELPPPTRVRCGGIFGGFYSSSSSSYWLPDDLGTGCSGAGGRVPAAAEGGTPHARRGWVWAFASPMRAFRASSSSSTKQATIVSVNGAVTAGAGGGSAAPTSTVAAARPAAAAALLAVNG
uniref:Uncharacterized protein n=1 Tax=Anthurium amnicola TaxID=1678845 RepID=A0A1D1XKD3_9ARAE